MGFRIRKCRGSAKVVLPASGGVSVSNHQNEAGESTVTICSILQDNSKSCQTIMNPDGIMVSSISNMGNTLQVSTTALLQWMQSSNLPNSLKKISSNITEIHNYVKISPLSKCSCSLYNLFKKVWTNLAIYFLLNVYYKYV